MFIVGLMFIASMIGIAIGAFLIVTSLTKEYYPNQIIGKEGQAEVGGIVLLISLIIFAVCVVIISFLP